MANWETVISGSVLYEGRVIGPYTLEEDTKSGKTRFTGILPNGNTITRDGWRMEDARQMYQEAYGYRVVLR